MDARLLESCPQATVLTDFALGRLDDASLGPVAIHVEKCEPCLEKLRATPVDPFCEGMRRIHEESDSIRLRVEEVDPASKLRPHFFAITSEAPVKDPPTFFSHLKECRLFDEDAVRALRDEWQAFRSSDAATFAQTLIVQGKLTEFQARQLIRGKTRGWILDDFAILHPHAAGASTQVYRGKHRHREQPVILKILLPEAIRQPNGAKRFQHDLDIVRAMPHPNLAPILAAGKADEVHFVVMEELPGCSLAQHLTRHGPMNGKIAGELLMQAAEGVGHAHANAVAHGDVKPSNLWLTEPTVVRVVDFGLSHLMQETRDPTKSKEARHALRLQAPERRQGAPPDPPSDIFSLGVTLFTLLTGQPPFGSTPLSALPAEWRPAFERMTAEAPSDRPASCDDLIFDIDKVVAGYGPRRWWQLWR